MSGNCQNRRLSPYIQAGLLAGFSPMRDACSGINMALANTSRQSSFAVLALIASVVLTIVLAWQAQQAAASQQRVAQQVLQDYSALIADEFIRRATVQLGFRGYYDLVTTLHGQGYDSIPANDVLRGNAEVHSSDLAGGIVFYNRATAELIAQPGMDALMVERLQNTIESLALAPDDMQPFAFVGATHGDRYRMTVVSAAAEGETLVAIEINTDALGAWLSPVVADTALLPASLVDNEFSNEDVYVNLSDPAGFSILKNGFRYDPDMLVRRTLGNDYQGILENFELVAGIDPAVAPRLVIGGLPGSRLPIIGVLLLLSIAMVVAAILQLKRERELMQMRSDFVAQVSHELRTPLTQIRMFAETLLFDRVRNDDDRQRALKIINRESQRLAHLVENVLQFSRGERDQLDLDMQDCAAVPLVEQLVREFEPLSGATRIGIDCMVGRDSLVRADSDALKQILLNLFDNALKYGPEKQYIRVVIEQREKLLVIAVEDEGPGIPADEREKIWAGYYRLSREKKRAIAGTGIGLAVVRELVSLHGGHCRVDDSRAGGARFAVELPLIESGRNSVSGADGTIQATGVTE